MKIAISYNLEKKPKPGEPYDLYAEFDEIIVPQTIARALESAGHSVCLIEEDYNFVENLKNNSPDFVFNITEGLNSHAREAQVPAILDLLNIKYTGSGVITLAIGLDKCKTKDFLLLNKIPTARHQLFHTGKEQLKKELRFPLIVKPNYEGSSIGITNKSFVRNKKELYKMINYTIKRYKQSALVEEFLSGREFTVSIIGNKKLLVLPIVEIILDKLPKNYPKINSYKNKHKSDDSKGFNLSVCPAKINKKLEEKIKKVAINTYKILNCKDFARVDIRLDQKNRPQVIEINTLPSLNPREKYNSSFVKSGAAAGLNYEQLILKIVNESLKRQKLK